MAKKRERAPWYLRMRLTTRLKTRISEILREWPVGGKCTSDSEMDVADAFKAWERDMDELPESKA